MKRKLFITVVLVAFSVFCELFAQCAGDIIALPTMFVDKKTTIARAEEFYMAMPSKFDKLSEVNYKQDIFINYTQKAISRLFDILNKEPGSIGIRIYFARYNICDDSPLPASVKESQLILLFASEFEETPPKDYFFINGNDDALYPVSSKCAEKWINNYMQKNQPGLRATIEASDTDNEDETPVKFSDTKSIFYRKDQVDSAFKKEEAYQLAKHQIKIAGYQLVFSAYTSEGDESGHFKNRLFVQFNYLYNLDGRNKILYLDEQEDYTCRKRVSQRWGIEKMDKKKTTSENGEQKSMFINNGQLCPTHCPPPPPPGGLKLK